MWYQKIVFVLMLFSTVSLFSQTINTRYVLKTTNQMKTASFRDAGMKLIKQLSTTDNIYLVESEDGEQLNTDLIARNQNIQFISIDTKLEMRETVPNDTYYSEQWYLEKINASAFWDMNTGGLTQNGDTIVIAIIDGGFDIAHEDYDNIFWQNKGEIQGDNIDNDNNGYIDDINGWNFINNSPDFYIVNHGNYVIGAMGASGDNNIGISGVNWHIKVILLNIQNKSQIIEAYGYVRDLRQKYNDSNGEEGAFIIATNTSLGLDNKWAADYPIWCEMYDKMGEVGIVSIGSTTNLNSDIDEKGDMPTTCDSPYLIAVTNSDIDDKKASAGYSKKYIDLAAPGENIYTTGLSNQYKNVSGTSLSAPQVSGAVALLATLPSDTLNRMFFNQPSKAALLLKNSILNGVTTSFDLEKYTASGGRLDLIGATEAFKKALGTNQENVSLVISPNPVEDILSLEYGLSSQAKSHIDIYDIAGRRILTMPISSIPYEFNTQNINVSGLTNGLYFITLTNSKDIVTQKFIKQ